CYDDVTFLDSVDEFFELSSNIAWDIIVIDLRCPGSFCFVSRCINTLPQVNVIVLSQRYSLQEKFKCYELGAEMYLVKPFSPVDILNAIALVKERDALHSSKKSFVKLSTSSRIMYFNDSLIRLSIKECLLVYALALADQRKLESWQLMERLNILDFDNGHKYLGIIVSRLRTKLRKYNFPEHAITAVRGYGYQLTIPIQLVL
ncbi:hypothetical protein CYQ88_07155, partial [Hydrogenovibrio sp. SC-1]|uniref:response regulator transcription factor n=1 Tax=Hydrogenovibrio sp. SC-1 TaxID=2065820 RepID=UPI000CB6F901